ncbi:MAG: GNAT family protein [Candidatus Gracilibacteria bacterium]
MQLEGAKIILRKFKIEDADQVYENVREPSDRPWAYTIKDPYLPKDAIEWIEKTHKDFGTREAFQFAVVLKETGEVIGGAGLHSINWDNRKAEVGYLIRKQDRGKGYATCAVHLLLDHAFKELQLNKIGARMFSVNEASRKILEKYGFTLEGTFRKERFKDGVYYDELRYGLLYSEHPHKSTRPANH